MQTLNASSSFKKSLCMTNLQTKMDTVFPLDKSHNIFNILVSNVDFGHTDINTNSVCWQFFLYTDTFSWQFTLTVRGKVQVILTVMLPTFTYTYLCQCHFSFLLELDLFHQKVFIIILVGLWVSCFTVAILDVLVEVGKFRTL